MKDRHVSEVLSRDYAAGRLSETQADEYEEHLLSCTRCYDSFYVDLAQEQSLTAFTSEHRALGKEVFAKRRGKTLRVRMAKLAGTAREVKDEVRGVLERFLEGARLATMYPQVATVRGSDTTTVAIDHICRDFVVFGSMHAGQTGRPVEFEFKTRARFLVHYVKETNSLRIQLPEGSQEQVTRISILKGGTEEVIGTIGTSADSRSFDIPLDMLSDDVTLSWS